MHTNSNKSSSFSVFVLSHTHWDREWYLSHRQFQCLLSDTLDEILDLLDQDPHFVCFMVDGQTSLTHDYLEIRPSRGEQLKRLAQTSRVLFGPWYTMPDLWLPSGESLIRNLLRGRLDCEQLGCEPQQVGYVPDSFGHIEQMPQILNGFGIDNYFFSRGKPESLPKDAPLEFNWRGPDGESSVLACRLPHGYHNAMLLPSAEQEDVLQSRIAYALAAYRSSAAPVAVLFNGVDHIWVQRDLPMILEKLKALNPEIDWHHGSLSGYMAELRSHLSDIKLPSYQGCLRDTHLQAEHLHGTWSSRIDNKIENSMATWLLESLAEPLAALSLMMGGHDRREMLNLAWQHVLQNHAHDSICGCSDDRVHTDVNQRFRHAQEIAEMVVADIGRALAHGVAHDRGPCVTRIAGAAGADSIVEVIVDLDYAVETFALIDEQGRLWPTQSLGVRHLRCRNSVLAHSGEVYSKEKCFYEHRVLALLPEASPMEVQHFVIGENEPSKTNDPVIVKQYSLENNRLFVKAETDGTLTVFHKETGLYYGGLLELLDDADAGGGYFFKPIDGDNARSSKVCEPHIDIVEPGPLRGKLRISYEWSLPIGLSQKRCERQAKERSCLVNIEIALESGSEQLSVALCFINKVEDHRLRVNLPLPFSTVTADVERAFVVTRDDISRFSEEPGQDTHPMRNWVDCTNRKGGLAFIGHGLHEFALEPNASKNTNLYVTLLRSVPFVFMCGSWKTPEALLSGKIQHKFALLFHKDDWRQATVPKQAAHWLSPNFIEQIGQSVHEWESLPHASVALEEEVSDGDWQTTSSHRSTWRRYFGERDGWRRHETNAAQFFHSLHFPKTVAIKTDNVLLSAFKPTQRDDMPGVILRFYNSSPESQEALIYLNFSFKSAYICDLSELPDEQVSLSDSHLKLLMKPFQIRTLWLKT